MSVSADCPGCQRWHAVDLLATANEWKYYCREADIRFNADGEVYNQA